MLVPVTVSPLRLRDGDHAPLWWSPVRDESDRGAPCALCRRHAPPARRRWSYSRYLQTSPPPGQTEQVET
ncbi:hypothetical protein GCM10027080_38400 [Pedococcus soli]